MLFFSLMKRSKNQGLQKKKLNFPSLRYAERAMAMHRIKLNQDVNNICTFPLRFRRKPACGRALHSGKFLTHFF